MRRAFLVSITLFALASLAQAEPRTSITRTSPNHTKIVIHDSSPQAAKQRDAQVQEARRMRERERERAHEIELAKIRAGQTTVEARPATRARQTANNDMLPSIEERRRIQAEANRPAPFMNGGQWTGGFAGFGFGGFGFPGFGPGFGPVFGPGFGPAYGPGFGPGVGFVPPCRPVYRPRCR